LLAERADIAEELTRLAHHIEQTEKAIGGNEPAGKKLDFLSQEMLREINTMGSKSRSATLRMLVVELKTEVERIREQVQNVENFHPDGTLFIVSGPSGAGKTTLINEARRQLEP